MAMASAILNKIERAHQMYRDGKHEGALEFYTEALAVAKSKVQKIALHSNRAACYLKLQDFKQAADECTSVLELDHQHTGALMLRAQTLVTLKEYQCALFDVNRLMELNPTSDVYQNLQTRLKTQLSLAPIPESEEEEALAAELEEERGLAMQLEEENEQEVVAEVHDRKIESSITNPEVPPAQTKSLMDPSNSNSNGWEAVSKPKGHSRLDYSKWDELEDDSSEEEDDEEDSQPQYRFRVKTVGVRPVK